MTSKLRKNSSNENLESSLTFNTWWSWLFLLLKYLDSFSSFQKSVETFIRSIQVDTGWSFFLSQLRKQNISFSNSAVERLSYLLKKFGWRKGLQVRKSHVTLRITSNLLQLTYKAHHFLVLNLNISKILLVKYFITSTVYWEDIVAWWLPVLFWSIFIYIFLKERYLFTELQFTYSKVHHSHVIYVQCIMNVIITIVKI